jgi:hypothetical protein
MQLDWYVNVNVMNGHFTQEYQCCFIIKEIIKIGRSSQHLPDWSYSLSAIIDKSSDYDGEISTFIRMHRSARRTCMSFLLSYMGSFRRKIRRWSSHNHHKICVALLYVRRVPVSESSCCSLIWTLDLVDVLSGHALN